VKKETILVTGGARGGKSAFAERFAERSGTGGFYIAAAVRVDEEMERRIERHRQRRSGSVFEWKTIEEPRLLPRRVAELARAARDLPPDRRILLIDCLTIWLTNLLLPLENDPGAEDRCLAETDALIEALRDFPGLALLVTNEVGFGIVPDTPLGRLFRDAAGRMNQRIAAAADRVFLVVAGIPVEMKSRAFLL